MTKNTGKGCLAGTHAGHLVLDLSAAKTPGCLTLDLKGLSFAFFHVRLSESGAALGYSDLRGEFTQLALFADQAAADRVLAQIRQAMLAKSAFLRLAKKIAFIGLALFLLVALLNFIGILTLAALPEMEAAAPPGLAKMGTAPARGGMPVDADTRLKPPG